MSFTESKNVSPAREDNTDFNYNKALALLRSNTPEQILDIQLPYSKYMQLEKAFSRLNPESGTIAEKSYPSLSYDSGTETVTVVTVPSNVHEAGVYQINFDIIGYARNYLSTHSPQSKNSIVPFGSTTTRGFHGLFANCVKQPDGGVRHITRQDDMVTVVIEVGASERYTKLCRDKDIWIDGLGVKVFILVCINESPQFKMPSAEYDMDIEDPEAEVILMRESMAATLESNLLLNRIAPFVYRRQKWGGQLRTAFIEVCRPDSIPIRYVRLDSKWRHLWPSSYDAWASHK
ncbi:hypothetical protein V1524DRAFT_382477 [Lipomyces starkeyi]